MKSKSIKRAGIVSASLVGVAATQTDVQATNLFDTEVLGSGSEIRNVLLNTPSSFVGLDELKCGEGKCGEGKCGEGKCGEKHKKGDKMAKKEMKKEAKKEMKKEAKAEMKDAKKEMKKEAKAAK